MSIDLNSVREDFNKIFSNNLKHYLKVNNMTQVELANKLGVGTTTVSSWVNALKSPRMDKLDKMCEIFGVKRSDLMDSHNHNEEKYYIDKDTSQIAQEIFENKELRLLFDSARDSSPEDLKAVHEMLLALKRKENHEDD